jgi:hypothetical protein
VRYRANQRLNHAIQQYKKDSFNRSIVFVAAVEGWLALVSTSQFAQLTFGFGLAKFPSQTEMDNLTGIPLHRESSASCSIMQQQQSTQV